MVAAAGEQSAMQPAVGVALVAFTLAMLGLLTFISVRFAVVHRIPLPRSSDSRKDRAQELIERFGFRDTPADTAYEWDREYLSYARPKPAAADLWPALASGRTRTATFWYRTSPTMLVPSYSNTRPTEGDPPLLPSDMRRIRLDAHGRLIEFHSMTPQVEQPAADGTPAVDWAARFEAAALPTCPTPWFASRQRRIGAVPSFSACCRRGRRRD